MRGADAGTTAAYAPDDPLLFGPAPDRFGRPRTIALYKDGRLAAGWRDLSPVAHMLAAAPPPSWRGRVIEARFVPGRDLVLRAPAPLDTRGGGLVRLAVNGGRSGGQRVALSLTYDGGRAGTPIPFTLLVPGYIPAGRWITVQLPVQNAVPPGARVDGVRLVEVEGRREQPLYIGSITLQMVPLARAATPSVPISVGVDAMAGRHAISPYIYGLAGDDGDAYLRALRPTLLRWGGSSSSRYNWRIGHAWNAGSDYFYHNENYASTGGSASDRFVARAKAAGTASQITVPTLGWVARDTTSFSFPGARGEPTNGRGASCTNPGVRADPRRTSIRVGPDFMQDWVRHLEAEHADLRFFAMDNEPDLWGSTHYDVHPMCTGYDEIYHEFTTYASAVKKVAPRAMVTGPVSCCWQFYFHSQLGDLDRARHDGLGFLPWFLQAVRRYDRAHHKRTLDVLDIHYYPEGAYNNNGDAVTAAWRLQETRSLWDPTYVDHSWINQPVRLIPRMNSLIDTYYPRTKLGISEWNWGAEGTVNGALAVADVLGVYGRQGLYMAAYWNHPPAGSPAALAFQMFRNYDGRGASFGDTSVRTLSSNGNRLSVYASLRRRDGHLLVLLANKMPSTSANASLDLRGVHGKIAQVYRYGAADPGRIVHERPQAVRPHMQLRVPPYTMLLLDVGR